MIAPDALLGAATAAGLKLQRLAVGFYRVDTTRATVTISLPVVEGDAYAVRRKSGRRWRTMGKWKTVDRVVREAKFWSDP